MCGGSGYTSTQIKDLEMRGQTGSVKLCQQPGPAPSDLGGVFQELRNAYSEEVMGIRREEEMEMSEDDSEEGPCKRMRTGEPRPGPHHTCLTQPVVIATTCATAGAMEQSLKEENDSLRWQLDSYRSEVELLRREQPRSGREEEPALSHAAPDVQIQLLQQSLHSVQQVGPRTSERSAQHVSPGVSRFVLQHLLSLQDALRTKEAELEQEKAEHRCLEGQMLALQEKVRSLTPRTKTLWDDLRTGGRAVTDHSQIARVDPEALINNQYTFSTNATTTSRGGRPHSRGMSL